MLQAMGKTTLKSLCMTSIGHPSNYLEHTFFTGHNKHHIMKSVTVFKSKAVEVYHRPQPAVSMLIQDITCHICPT